MPERLRLLFPEIRYTPTAREMGDGERHGLPFSFIDDWHPYKDPGNYFCTALDFCNTLCYFVSRSLKRWSVVVAQGKDTGRRREHFTCFQASKSRLIFLKN